MRNLLFLFFLTLVSTHAAAHEHPVAHVHSGVFTLSTPSILVLGLVILLGFGSLYISKSKK